MQAATIGSYPYGVPKHRHSLRVTPGCYVRGSYAIETFRSVQVWRGDTFNARETWHGFIETLCRLMNPAKPIPPPRACRIYCDGARRQ